MLSRSITRRVESPRMAANSPRHLIVRCCKLHLHIYIHDTFGRYRWHTRGCARRNGASRENGPELVRYVIPVEVEVSAGAAAWRQAGPPLFAFRHSSRFTSGQASHVAEGTAKLRARKVDNESPGLGLLVTFLCEILIPSSRDRARVSSVMSLATRFHRGSRKRDRRISTWLVNFG